MELNSELDRLRKYAEIESELQRAEMKEDTPECVNCHQPMKLIKTLKTTPQRYYRIRTYYCELCEYSEKTVIFATYIGKRKNKYRYTSARHNISITSDTPLELEKWETYQMNINYTE